MTTYYKFLHFIEGEIRSDSGYCTWQVGAWQELEGQPRLCERGFHCSEKPLDALGYVDGNILARVEVGGESEIGEDKSCWQRMKIIQAWQWGQRDNRQLAIFAAEQVLPIFEKEYPGDQRPRKAIEAAKERLLAWAAARAAASDAASDAARAAARAAARDAARAAASDAAWAAARDAAWDAAWAAARAAASDAASDAARAAASDAARAAMMQKINDWMVAHIAELTPLSLSVGEKS